MLTVLLLAVTIYPVFFLRRLARRLRIHRILQCILGRLARRPEKNTGYIVTPNRRVEGNTTSNLGACMGASRAREEILAKPKVEVPGRLEGEMQAGRAVP